MLLISTEKKTAGSSPTLTTQIAKRIFFKQKRPLHTGTFNQKDHGTFADDMVILASHNSLISAPMITSRMTISQKMFTLDTITMRREKYP